MVFGSKRACFKCNTPKGAKAEGGGGATIDTVSLTRENRDMIKDLIHESDTVTPTTSSALQTSTYAETKISMTDVRQTKAVQRLYTSLTKTGFRGEDIDAALNATLDTVGFLSMPTYHILVHNLLSLFDLSSTFMN